MTSAQTFLKSLVDTARSLDGSRLISAAMEVHGDNVQDGWNRKSLVGENGTKKKAFAVLKSFYDELEQRAAGLKLAPKR